MLSKQSSLILLLACCVTSTSALAGMIEAPARCLVPEPFGCLMSAPFGWLVEGNVGFSKVSGKTYGGSITNSRIAGNLNVGYKFMPYFATEIGNTYYSIVSVRTAGVTAGQDRHVSYHLAARVIFPVMTVPVEFFAKVGISYLQSKVSLKNEAAAASIGLTYGTNHHTGLYLGLGGQYYFTSQSALVFQWQQAGGNSETGTVNMLTIGLSYLYPGPY